MDNETDPVWIDILQGSNTRWLEEAVFVLTALGIKSHVSREEPQDLPQQQNAPGQVQWRLFVPEEEAPRAVSELEAYRVENQQAPPPVPTFQPIDSGWSGVLMFLMVIWALPTFEYISLFGWHWHDLGVMHAGAVKAGEWWRVITALTLHADLPHLLGNSLFGAIFGLLVGRNLGSGLGWLLVLLSAAAGNGLNAWLQADAFRSIGASTANFAALGVSAAYIWRRGYYLPNHNTGRWRRAFAPVFAAIALLAYTGTGGENTDIVAHFTGFACGVCAGLIAAHFNPQRLGRSGQWLAGTAAMLLVAFAWALAGIR